MFRNSLIVISRDGKTHAFAFATQKCHHLYPLLTKTGATLTTVRLPCQRRTLPHYKSRTDLRCLLGDFGDEQGNAGRMTVPLVAPHKLVLPTEEGRARPCNRSSIS
jgi:hypothetical protein